MDEKYNRDPFEPDVTDTTYRSQNIQDESNIFEEKVTPSYEAPRYDAWEVGGCEGACRYERPEGERYSKGIELRPYLRSRL